MKKILSKLECLKEEKYNISIKVICAILFPFFVCIIHCALQGGQLTDVYLANSQNNDDVFYYMQVAGMVDYGIPQGYFGFDESHALNLSFAAWSPFVLIVWAVWGKLFGWSISGYFFCNIIFHSLALAFLVYQIRPKIVHMLTAGILIGIFPGFAKYTLSCLAETHMMSYFLIYYGLALGYVREKKQWKLIGMYLLAFFLTCIRPYLVLLVILPGLFYLADKKKRGIFITVAMGLGSVVSYFAISKFFTAAYFTPLFDKSLFTRFTQDGFADGLRHLISHSLYCLKTLVACMGKSFTEGEFLGSNYCVLILLCLLLFVCFCNNKEDKLYRIVHIHYVCTAMISAVALVTIMGKINEGSRHIISFLVVGFLLISMIKKKIEVWKPVIAACLLLFLFYYYPDDGQDYQIPIRTSDRVEEQLAWEEIMSGIEVSENAPSFENTVVWTFSDRVEGKVVYMDWQPLLALPYGMGISCCRIEYIEAEFANLQSRYIMAVSDGEVAAMCREFGCKEIGAYRGVVLFQKY